MEYRVLGPVEWLADGRPVAIGGPKPRIVPRQLAEDLIPLVDGVGIGHRSRHGEELRRESAALP
jgi:hypothetical protein